MAIFSLPIDEIEMKAEVIRLIMLHCWILDLGEMETFSQLQEEDRYSWRETDAI